MAVTLREIAKKAGVSAMTVSRVLNGGYVAAETRARIEAAIAELEYIPNRVAKSLNTNKSGTIGLIVPDMENPFFTLVLRGAEMTARRAGYRLLVCNSEDDLRLERDFIYDLVSHRVEGLLLAPVSDRSKPAIAPLLRQGFPMVLVDRAVPGVDCDLVKSDNVAAARRLTNHLLEIGHRRIAKITDSADVDTGRERMQGYLDAMQAAGLPAPDDLTFHTTMDRIGGYRAMQEILALPERPTAVFADNNMSALGAMQALRERELQVPRDIALVCFDDVEHLAILSPFLTVVDQPAQTFGNLAAQLLLERIQGQAGERSRRTLLQADLIIRESCGHRAGPPKTGVRARTSDSFSTHGE